MNKLYCSCGSPTFYELKKPNVCSSCGQPFNATFKREAKVNEISNKELAKNIKDILREELMKEIGGKSFNRSEYEGDEEDNSSLKQNLINIAKASVKKVKISIAKNPTLEDLKDLKEPIQREKRNQKN